MIMEFEKSCNLLPARWRTRSTDDIIHLQSKDLRPTGANDLISGASSKAEDVEGGSTTV